MLDSGTALERLRKNIEMQGGDPKICDKPETLLSKGLVKTSVKANATGFVSMIDTFRIGSAICEIGGGRTKAEDTVDHAIGFACRAKLGDFVEAGDTLGILFCRNQTQANAIRHKLTSAYKLSPENNQKQPKLIQQIIGQ